MPSEREVKGRLGFFPRTVGAMEKLYGRWASLYTRFLANPHDLRYIHYMIGK